MSFAVRCFPRSDRRLARRVEEVLNGREVTDELLRRALRELRSAYPHIRIVRQSSLGAQGPRVIYVYRDGEAVTRSPG